MIHKKTLAALLVFSILFSGCAWFKADRERTADELVSEGMDSFRSGRYKDAIGYFGKLKDWYPYSPYAMLAELKIADAYYGRDEYAEAIAAYEEFESLHPLNEAVPYVIYRIGRSHFEQITSPDRDQTPARKALDTFQRLQQQYPGDPYAIKAEAHIKKCIKNMTDSEFRVGLHYYKTKHYRGALARFKSVISDYPDVGVHYLALNYIADCEEKLRR